MKTAISNVHKIRRSFQKKNRNACELWGPSNKLKNVTLKRKGQNLKFEKMYKPSNFMSEFWIYIFFFSFRF